MIKIIIIVTSLMSSLTLTGISFVDEELWNQVFKCIAMISYAIVSLAISAGISLSNKQRKELFLLLFGFFALLAFGFYKALVKVEEWIHSWPLYVKILVPVIVIGGLTIALFFAVKSFIKERKTREEKDPDYD